jgi:hypothetical protein
MHPVVGRIIAFYGTVHTTIISTNKINNNVTAFVYLVKALLHVSTFTRSSSSESIEM